MDWTANTGDHSSNLGWVMVALPRGVGGSCTVSSGGWHPSRRAQPRPGPESELLHTAASDSELPACGSSSTIEPEGRVLFPGSTLPSPDPRSRQRRPLGRNRKSAMARPNAGATPAVTPRKIDTEVAKVEPVSLTRICTALTLSRSQTSHLVERDILLVCRCSADQPPPRFLCTLEQPVVIENILHDMGHMQQHGMS